MRRYCEQCRLLLAPNGHGFPTIDGKGIKCGSCTYPKKRKKEWWQK